MDEVGEMFDINEFSRSNDEVINTGESETNFGGVIDNFDPNTTFSASGRKFGTLKMLIAYTPEEQSINLKHISQKTISFSASPARTLL